MLEHPRDRWTLLDALAAQAKRYGERVFCTFEDDRSLSFAELARESEGFATALADLGIEAGDRVMAFAFNSRAFLVAFFGTMKRGAIYVPVNTELKGAFLEHQLRNTTPRALIVDAELRGAFDTVGNGEALAAIGHTIAISPGTTALPGTQLHDVEALAATAPRADAQQEARPHDIAMIMFTSGTTGPSKGVMMPQAHCRHFGYSAGRSQEMTDADVMYICMPFFHAMGLLLQFVSCLLAGSRAHVVRRFSATRWLDDVRACGATLTYGLGVIPEFIFRQPAREEDDDNALRQMIAVPIGDSWGHAFEARFGLKLKQAYGMTECNIPVYADVNEPLIAGCAGRLDADFFELRVVDAETDQPVATGEIGEVVVRPKEASCFMAGYWGMPERTVEAWRNLWFHTGDAGKLDAEGRLHFVDRIKDCIRRRGENISAYEVEQVLNEHPGVAESCVIGVRTTEGGGEEEVLAHIVPAGDMPDPIAVLDFCAVRMPRYAVPRFLAPARELDKTPSGKLRKQDLRDAGIGPDAWDREDEGYELAR